MEISGISAQIAIANFNRTVTEGGQKVRRDWRYYCIYLVYLCGQYPKLYILICTRFIVGLEKFAEENYEKPEPASDAIVVELDEMWHHIQKKETKSGCGGLFLAILVNLSTGSVGER